MNILKQEPSISQEIECGLPKACVFPLPADSFVSIEYRNNVACRVNVSVYNGSGAKVLQYECGVQSEGTNTFQFSVGNLKPGMYYYWLKTGNSLTTGSFSVNH